MKGIDVTDLAKEDEKQKKREKKKVEMVEVYINGSGGCYKINGKKYKNGEKILDKDIEQLTDLQLANEIKSGNIKVKMEKLK